MNSILLQEQKDALHYYVCKNRDEMGKLSAEIAATKIKEIIREKDEARIIFASAPSQNEFISHLVNDESIVWSRVVGFHMDEYIGLPANSDQWFQLYLEEHLVS